MVLSVLKEENQYRRLFLAGVVNGIGDRFSQVAMMALLIKLTGSGLAVGITMFLRMIPFLLFGTLGGILADRLPRKYILVTTDLFRILFALSFLFVNGKEDIWIVYVSSFALAIGESLYAPARKSSIPELAKAENLVRINSMEQVLTGIVLIAGAFAGGIVAYLFGPHITFWLNAASFLFAAAMIAAIRFPALEKADVPNSAPDPAPKHQYGVFTVKNILIGSAALQLIFLAEIILPFISGFDNVLISVYAIKVFSLGDIGVGIFYGALGIGLVLSSLVAGRMKNHLLRTGTVFMILEGASIALLSQAVHPVSAFLLFCCNAFMAGIGGTCFDSVLMKETPKDHQGLVFGLLATIGNTMIGLSMLLAGIALDFVPPRVIGMAAGLALVLIGVCFMALIHVKKSYKQAA